MKKTIITILIFLIGGLFGYLVFYILNPGFARLNPEEKYTRIIKERDYAINEAVLAGNFRCCIDPPCTMCYLEANQWNNYTAGTCACDDLIAQGQEACPQCERGLDDIHNEINSFCDIDATISDCDSTK